MTSITFAHMENSPPSPTPPNCFRLEELEKFQSLEGRLLAGVTYYLWLRRANDTDADKRFLYTLELVFDSGESLLLSSGEDTEAIRVITAEQLVDMAGRLHKLHGESVIRRMPADTQPLWHDAIGKALQGIRVSPTLTGLYLNDALVFDFGEFNILVHLSRQEGLMLYRKQQEG